MQRLRFPIRSRSVEIAERNFFAELKRRNVVRMAGLYLVGAWLLVQVAGTILPMFGAPEWLPRTIVVLLAIGFVPVLIFSWAFELTPQGLKRDAEVAPEESIAPQTARRMDRMIIAVLLLALGYFAFDKFVLTRRAIAPPIPIVASVAVPMPAATAISEKSVAVLPFENLSSDKENAYFAEGIQDEILTRLAKIGALKVISRTSTSHLASSPQNLPEIARQLGVANILEGSVQKAANAVHVNVQLIRAATDDHLWAESYNRKLDDIFGVEAEVAETIASALNARLTGAEQQLLAQKPTSNPAAYDAYLRGLSSLGNVTGDLEKSFNAAAQSFEEAVRIDPQFALAWAKLCRAHSIIYFNQFDRSEARRTAAANAMAEAIRLQPQLPEAQLAQADFQYWVQLDYKGARDIFQRLHLSWPSNADIAQDLGWVSARLGQWKESAEYLDEAITLNPRDLFLRQSTIAGHIALREFPTALRMLDEALQIWPDNTLLLAKKAAVFQGTGQLDEAQAIVDHMRPDTDRDSLQAFANQATLRRTPAAVLTYFKAVAEKPAVNVADVSDLFNYADVLELSGDKTKARAMFLKAREGAEVALKQQPDNPVPLVWRAYFSAALGERDAALNGIDQALALTANDARNHGAVEEVKARMLVRLGETDGAITLLQHLLEIPYNGGSDVPLTPALLRLDPAFDSLRGDPRFEKLCQASR
jgi:TolB-like protein/Tfp pilus assembly protein PilF